MARRDMVIGACLLASGLLALTSAVGSAQQQGGEIRLIVQGDDMGGSHGFNVGTVKAYQEGILRATNVLTPAPWTSEAVQLLQENPGLDVGVHLTLTGEWTTMRWRPLTTAPSLVDTNGYLFQGVRSRRGEGEAPGAEEKRELGEIEKELRAQIELGKKMVPWVSYMSTHMGFGSLSPEVEAIVQKLSKEYGLVMAGGELGIERLDRPWDAADPAEVRAEKLAAMLSSLGPGTWLMIEHCGTDTPEIQALGRNVAFDRSNVVAAWTHPRVIEAVKKRGIKLTNYRELTGRP